MHAMRWSRFDRSQIDLAFVICSKPFLYEGLIHDFDRSSSTSVSVDQTFGHALDITMDHILPARQGALVINGQCLQIVPA